MARSGAGEPRVSTALLVVSLCPGVAPRGMFRGCCRLACAGFRRGGLCGCSFVGAGRGFFLICGVVAFLEFGLVGGTGFPPLAVAGRVHDSVTVSRFRVSIWRDGLSRGVGLRLAPNLGVWVGRV